MTREQYAGEVRRECIMIMSRAAFGPNKEAAMPAGQLFQRAANIVHGAQMQRELEAGPELAGLGKWIDQPGLLE